MTTVASKVPLRAVIGTGITRCYPAENEALAESIVEHGKRVWLIASLVSDQDWAQKMISRGHARVVGSTAELVAVGTVVPRAVASVKKHYRAGNVRVQRPWVTEPGCGCGTTSATAR